MNSLLFCFLALGVLVNHAEGSGHCPSGSPLMDHFCGRGGTKCPDHYYCNVAPNDAYAECCPTKCPSGAPLLSPDGSAVYCGRGGDRCPTLYRCEIAANDAYAVCCLE